MANQIIESVVNYEGKSVRELFIKPTIQHASLQEQGIRIFEGDRSRLFLYYTNAHDKLTKLAGGCGWTGTGNGVDITRKPITTSDVKFEQEQCYAEFLQTIWEDSLKTGYDVSDLSNTELAAVLSRILTPTIGRDMVRQVWFGDTSLTNNNYNLYNGLFKHIHGGIASSTIVNHTITAMTTGTDAYNALLEVYNNQPLEMKSKGNKKFLVTRNIYDKYVQYLSTLNGSEAAYTNVVNGLPIVSFMGIPVIPMDIWDNYFLADFPSYFNFGRIILHVAEEALVVGIDNSEKALQFQAWHEMKDEKMYFRAKYQIGTELHWHEYLSVGGF